MDDLVVVGVVGKPFGVRGECYVRPDPDTGDDFPVGRTYRVSAGPAGHPSTLTVAHSHLHSGRWVVRFEDAVDRDGAEAVRGCVLAVPRTEATLDEGAFWTADLLGREVVDDAGDLVGVLEATADGAAHDYLVVARPDGGELLIPAVEELVDVDDERIVVHVIPGLLEP